MRKNLNLKISLKSIIILICSFIVLFVLVCLIYNLFFSNEKNNILSGIFTVISFLIGIVSLVLTLLSFNIVYSELKNGGHCSKKDAEKGGKQLAEYINSFQPSKILYVAGNSGELYKRYIAKHIKCHCNIIELNSYCRIHNGYVGSAPITTNKFIIDISPTLFNGNEKIVILDDITKTGETITEIKEYLIKTCKISKINIITCGFATDIYGFSRYAEPAFYYKRVKINDNYIFPWRK